MKSSDYHHTPSLTVTDVLRDIDMPALLAYRLDRIREQLVSNDCAAAVLYDSVNIRYATGTSNMPVFGMHFQGRYCFVPVQGPIVLFELPSVQHIWRNHKGIDEIRDAIVWRSVFSGPDVELNVGLWATEINDLLSQTGGENKRLAMDTCEPAAAAELRNLGITLIDGQEMIEVARSIKSYEELQCMNLTMAVAEVGMSRMADELKAGMTENQLWSIFSKANIELGGEWLECRLLTSGNRTNPWLQEASDKIIRPGELVAYDTDMIGPMGYCADVSRTMFCRPGKPNKEQLNLYALAYEQLQYNMSLMQPGSNFSEIAEKSWPVPDIYKANSYDFIAHGVGMCDEWPNVYPLDKLIKTKQADVVLEPGMVMAIESYIGAEGGHEGVKLEEQVVITETGFENMSRFPFEEILMSSLSE